MALLLLCTPQAYAEDIFDLALAAQKKSIECMAGQMATALNKTDTPSVAIDEAVSYCSVLANMDVELIRNRKAPPEVTAELVKPFTADALKGLGWSIYNDAAKKAKTVDGSKPPIHKNPSISVSCTYVVS